MVWGGLGAVWGGSWSWAQRPAQMHFRMRKPRSWLTLWGWFLVQFALFFTCVFVVFSTMHPERHFLDCCPISNTFSTTFGEVFEKAENSDFCNPSNEKTWFLKVKGLQFSIIFVIVFGPTPGHHF